jgi:hypothetical protein
MSFAFSSLEIKIIKQDSSIGVLRCMKISKDILRMLKLKIRWL